MPIQIFNSNYQKRPFYIVSIRDLICDSQPYIALAHGLKLLLQDKQCVTEGHEGKTYKVLRFLLKTNGELVFAHEGPPGDVVPSHWQMTGEENSLFAECYTAGNALFSIEDDLLQIINHKSGDFRPEFDSLLFLLPELIKNKIPMGNSLEIQQLDNSGALVVCHYINYEDVLECYHSTAQEGAGNSKALEHQASPPGFVQEVDLDKENLNASANKLYDELTFLNQSHNEHLTTSSSSKSPDACHQNTTLEQNLTSTEEQLNKESNQQVQRHTFFYYNEETAQQGQCAENQLGRHSM
ncbi:hypothetical protein [uncultured Legionella sp.]|uniref:hypothetical protein n=1 Tax=uncultured Legionella sp. TaxID=210934 RepID=UPI00260EEB2C|nr:hypothetical protein [uncultured Legionella sp.]